MDTLSLPIIPDEENDEQFKRQVQEAFPVEKMPTAPEILLERILIKAEALPQVSSEDAVAEETESASDVSPSVRIQQQRAAQSKVTPSIRQVRQLQQFNWQLYHQYLERSWNKANVGSGIQF
ncbi:MAG: hypothetical protein CUN55_09945 [Phototrophicales bacterium]|nr:MAG: hypothetical protein CUN55_09945 [Phototrophicales bacterium]